jgi:hypothetical protein
MMAHEAVETKYITLSEVREAVADAIIWAETSRIAAERATAALRSIGLWSDEDGSR